MNYVYELVYPLEDFPLLDIDASPPMYFGELNGNALIEYAADGDWRLAEVTLNESPSWDTASQSWRNRTLRLVRDELDWPKRRLFHWIAVALDRDSERINERIAEKLAWDADDEGSADDDHLHATR